MLKLSIYNKNKLVQGMPFLKSTVRFNSKHFIAFENKIVIFFFHHHLDPLLNFLIAFSYYFEMPFIFISIKFQSIIFKIMIIGIL